MSLTGEFEILGVPSPQGDKSAVMIGGKPRLIEGKRGSARAKHRDWRSAVAQAARDIARDSDAPFDGPLELCVQFRFPMPASRPKRIRLAGRAPKVSSPDLDKLLRALGDGLQAGGLITDDARIVEVVASKIEVTGWTGAVVELRRSVQAASALAGAL